MGRNSFRIAYEHNWIAQIIFIHFSETKSIFWTSTSARKNIRIILTKVQKITNAKSSTIMQNIVILGRRRNFILYPLPPVWCFRIKDVPKSNGLSIKSNNSVCLFGFRKNVRFQCVRIQEKAFASHSIQTLGRSSTCHWKCRTTQISNNSSLEKVHAW